MRDEIGALLSSSLPGVVPTEAQWARLLPLCRVRRLTTGAVAIAQGQPTPGLFGLLAGEIEARFSTVGGDVSVLEPLVPGRLFGLSSFASGRPSTFEAIATRPSRIVVFGPAAYAHLMDRVPGFARALMTEFARRHDGALRLLEASRHRRADERLSLALEQLLRGGRAGEVDASGWRFVRTTQAELAALAHLSRQTVNALMRDLARQQRVRLAYGGVWLAPS